MVEGIGGPLPLARSAAMIGAMHFIAELPRSGSTLLGALLRQNPAFHAGMTSPVGSVVGSCVELMSAEREAAHLVTPEQKRPIVRGLFDSYYAPMADKRVIFDTNRHRSARLTAAALRHCVRHESGVRRAPRPSRWTRPSRYDGGARSSERAQPNEKRGVLKHA